MEQKDSTDRFRFLAALIISLAVFMAWPLAMRYFYPQPAPQPTPQQVEPSRAQVAPQPTPPAVKKPIKTTQAVTPAPATLTQAAPREITLVTRFWQVRLSNRGGVVTSWVLQHYRQNGALREIKAADGSPLELVPQTAIGTLGAPFRLHIPSSPSLAEQFNQAYFQVEGASPDVDRVELQGEEKREITFVYTSPDATVRKTFTFYGDRFVFDAAASVTANGEQQPVGLVIGPRIGDQTDKLGGSYSTPPQVVAFTREEKREAFLGPKITPPFAKITGVDSSAKRIDLDKPAADGVDRVKLVSGDGKSFLGYSRVLERENGGQALILDSMPPGVVGGVGVAQATDTLRQGYRWAGLVDHYFAMVAVPQSQQSFDEIVLTSVPSTEGGDPARDYPSVAVPVGHGSGIRVFVGPKERELLDEVSEQAGAKLTALIDYGIFAIMIRPLVPLIGVTLEGLGRILHNTGWAIVVMTALINVTLSPLRWFSSKKMKAAAKHQPRMKELQERLKKLKENPKKNERELQQLQQEQIDLMKEANPLGGCLPMLLQMPIFWSFFVYLTISLDVRRTPWIGWIKDLSTPDPYKILPIVMCVTMIAQTKLTPQPASADPSMKMQRVMMTWLMPIMLTWFFFFNAPSGLVLYWMVSNVVGVLIQVLINKMTTEPPSGGETDLAPAVPGPKANKRKAGNVAVVRKQKPGKEIVEGAK